MLVDTGDRVLRAMPEMLSSAALKSPKAAGIEFLLKGRVQTMRPGEIIVGTPDGDVHLQATTVIWTAGVRASSLDKKLA